MRRIARSSRLTLSPNRLRQGGPDWSESALTRWALARAFITIDTEYSSGLYNGPGAADREENYARSITCVTPEGAHKAMFGTHCVACSSLVLLHATLANRTLLGARDAFDAGARRGEGAGEPVRRARPDPRDPARLSRARPCGG